MLARDQQGRWQGVRWRLSPAQLDVAWEELALGEKPYPLEVPASGSTLDEQAQVRARVLAEFAAAGLLAGGRVDAELALALRVLARPELSVDSVWLPDPLARVPCRVLAARSGAGAVVLAQDADPAAEFRIGAVRPDALEAAVLDWLPPAPGGKQPPLSLPVKESAALDSHDGSGSVLVDEPPGVRGERAYTDLAARPRLGSGQLAVNARQRTGRLRRSAVLHWFDVVGDGRYLAYRADGYVTVRPVDAGWLHRELSTRTTTLVSA